MTSRTPAATGTQVTTSQRAEARRTAVIESVQNRYNLLDREYEPVLGACEAAGIAFLPWRPVAAATPAHTKELDAIGAELGATAPQLLLAWLLARSPVVVPIPGTASLAHLEQNVAAADLRLNGAQLRSLDRPAGPEGTEGTA